MPQLHELFRCAVPMGHSTNTRSYFDDSSHQVWLLALIYPHFYLCPVSFSKASRTRRLFFRYPTHRAMSLAVPDTRVSPPHNMPTSTRRSLHRRSSCPSIPRSVSTCSSLWGLDSRILADVGEETYMAPLFRGPEGIGTTHKAGEQMSIILPESFIPRVKATPYDDSLSDSLSNYQFEIAEHEQGSEPLEASEGNVHMGQSPAPAPAHPNPSLPLRTHPAPKAPRRPLPADPVLGVDFPPPPLPPKVAKPIPPSTSTRPLQINRSKDRKQLGNSPQQTVHTGVQYGRPTARPIYRAATQVNLRDAYMKASPLTEQKTHARGLKPTIQPSLRPLHENPSPNATENVPITTLFPTGLIPLQHAQDKFKYAHCLERLPHPDGPTNSSTPPAGNHSPRPSGWSFSRAFRRQKG
ncbi:hypothetical protein BJV78DRAFT_618812 [Lactifluus subvellereus]|nr:hypothetical protein BJV78DRAFT_618812 [Lactifluus subvellereus]